MRMLGRGRPFVLEVINARALMPPQSYFDDAQKCLNEVTRDVCCTAVDCVKVRISSLTLEKAPGTHPAIAHLMVWDKHWTFRARV